MLKMMIFSSMSLGFLIFVFVFKVKIGVNVSDSMPRGIYIMTGLLERKFNKNDVVAFCPPKEDMEIFLNRKYISEDKNGICYHKFSPFIKHILAMEGDFIEIKNDSIFLNGAFIRNSTLYSTDRKGNPLSRLQNGYKKILLKNDFFAFADGVPRSIDSRYIGLVKMDKIISKSHLVWRFN